jgi:hypothetical protein
MQLLPIKYKSSDNAVDFSITFRVDGACMGRVDVVFCDGRFVRYCTVVYNEEGRC